MLVVTHSSRSVDTRHGPAAEAGTPPGILFPGGLPRGSGLLGGCRIRSRIIGAWVPCATCVQLVSQARGFDILIVVLTDNEEGGEGGGRGRSGLFLKI